MTGAWSEFAPALPEIVLAIAGMVFLMIGVFRGDRATGAVSYLVTLVFLVVATLVIFQEAPAEPIAFGGLFITDEFARVMKTLVLLGSAFALVMSQNFLRQESMARFEYPILFLFATLGMLMMISANDLISLYLSLELQSLSLYVIAAIQRDNLRSSEAGLKYFVLGALSSGMLLYGASLVYGFAGTTDFTAMAGVFAAGEAGPGVVVGLVFIIAGLAFKVSAVPFHMWTPDVYEGAPTPVTAFFAIAPKVAAMALFLRVMMGPFGDQIDAWQQVIQVAAIASMVLGAFAAIAQRNIKRLMAYSSIGHIGFALVGLAAGSHAGVRGVIIYMMIYLAMNIGTFTCILAMRVNGRAVEGVQDLAGLSRTRPMMAAALAILMFSLAGLPPLAGFFGKYYVFVPAIEAGLIPLAVIGVLASVVAAFYYIRIVKLMYFDEAAEALDPLTASMSAVLTLSTLFVLVFIIFPAPLIAVAGRAAQSLIGL